LRPGARLTLAGAGRHALIDELESADVDVVGFVEDVTALFDRSRAFACPVRIGSGIKGKLLTALAMGLPVVATPVAVEGMHMVDGVNCLVADSSSDFARACARLDEDDELWSRLSAGGLELVGRHFSREVVSRQVARAFGGMPTSSTGAPPGLAPATLAANE